MRLIPFAIRCAALVAAATSLSGCLAATAVGAAGAVAGTAVGVTSAAVKETVHVGHMGVNAATGGGKSDKDGGDR